MWVFSGRLNRMNAVRRTRGSLGAAYDVSNSRYLLFEHRTGSKCVLSNDKTVLVGGREALRFHVESGQIYDPPRASEVGQ